MKIAKYIEVIGLQILYLIGVTTLLSAISLLINIKITGNTLIIGLIFSIIYGFFSLSKCDIKKKSIYYTGFILNIVFILLLAISTCISGEYYDISFDGQAYHQEAIINLQEGWNPIYDEELDEKAFGNNIWVNHYAKGPWFFATAVYDFLGNIEYGKTGNILLLVSSFLLTFSLLLKIKIPKLFAIVISLLLSLNPVVTNQLLTFYIDGQLSSLFLIVVILMVNNYLKESFDIHIAIATALILLINIKFTALGYAIILCAIPVIFTLHNLIFVNKIKSIKTIVLDLLNQKYLYTLISGVLLGIFIVGASSYISNTIENKHPFYPLAGEGKVDIMSSNIPQGLINKSRIEQFYLSIFSEATNAIDGDLKSKFPFSITENELSTLGGIDTRIGGFGPLFGAVIIITVIGMLIWRREIKGDLSKIFLIIFSIISITIIINPEPWWARYIPQLWLLPLLFLTLLSYNNVNKNKYKNTFICILSLIIGVNTLLLQKANFEVIKQTSNDLTIQLKALEEYSQSNDVFVKFDAFRSNRIRLEMNNIKYIENDEISCENPMYLIFSNTAICTSNPELYAEIYAKHYQEHY